MSGLVACPFCRELFPRGEATVCPACGLPLAPLAALPPSAAAFEDELDGEPPSPLDAALPPLHAGDGKGLLLGLALAGLAAFFAPWVHERAPELRDLSGYDLARRLGWMWGVAVAWFTMLPLVFTRRSRRKMRGARAAVAFLAAVVVVTVAVRLAVLPAPSRLRPVRFDWGWGLYATAFLGAAALAAAFRLGGRAPAPAPAPPPRPPSRELLH